MFLRIGGKYRCRNKSDVSYVLLTGKQEIASFYSFPKFKYEGQAFFKTGTRVSGLLWNGDGTYGGTGYMFDSDEWDLVADLEDENVTVAVKQPEYKEATEEQLKSILFEENSKDRPLPAYWDKYD